MVIQCLNIKCQKIFGNSLEQNQHGQGVDWEQGQRHSIWMQCQTLLLNDCLMQRLQGLMSLSLHVLNQQSLKPSMLPAHHNVNHQFPLVLQQRNCSYFIGWYYPKQKTTNFKAQMSPTNLPPLWILLFFREEIFPHHSIHCLCQMDLKGINLYLQCTDIAGVKQ